VAGQLGAQRTLEDPAGELAHQPAGAGDLLRSQSLQRVLERVVGQQPREPITGLLNGTLSAGGSRRLAPIEAAWAVEARRHGRLSVPMDRFVRLMLVKARSGWGYETLVREVSDSLHLPLRPEAVRRPLPVHPPTG